MSITVAIGNKVFRKAFYEDMVVYGVTITTKSNQKYMRVFISSNMETFGLITETNAKYFINNANEVAYEREMNEKELLKYVKYISRITG